MDIEKSDNIAELAQALAKAQGKIESAHKDSSNPFFRSKYADLQSVWSACRDELSANGLAVIQIPHAEGDKAGVTTMLTHSSGQWIMGKLMLALKLPEKKDRQGNVIGKAEVDPQVIGSALTYARRYALSSFVGVAPKEDDGNSVSGKAEAKPKQKPAPKSDHKQELKKLMTASGEAWSESAMKEHFFAVYGEMWPPKIDAHWVMLINDVKKSQQQGLTAHIMA